MPMCVECGKTAMLGTVQDFGQILLPRPVDTGGGGAGGAMPPNNSRNLFLET